MRDAGCGTRDEAMTCVAEVAGQQRPASAEVTSHAQPDEERSRIPNPSSRIPRGTPRPGIDAARSLTLDSGLWTLD
jgi:hypothetical protein